MENIQQEDKDQVLDIHQLQQDQVNLASPVGTQVVDLADSHQLPVVEFQDNLADNIHQEDRDPV